ncbi:hydrogenase maturation protease [Mesobacillus sp. AQ2]|jgi:hydrogenase maturation protease|uniref:hydrogenase maturation protease n=1 Tax=Bacillaceae TaxID=186817 RepID=UPI0011A2658A|nr:MULTISPECIES: hydrogenase maturation protease [Bacillaceae]MCM3125810.1 hydrogenase maturation protease [Mesobacillus sp. MER 33]MCM3235831.1 hydrogenase maturation protease [Mesobacillus sp. MER 48]WHX40876.1 hydrogenase maturation protease [Mesobacillus sp. AQ2]
MEKVIVLGIGNMLMMDDGIGIYLVEELSRTNCDPDVLFLIGESDIDYCLEQIMGAPIVIIIDAAVSGKTPGSLTVYELADLHEHCELAFSPHDFHLFNLLYGQKESIRGYLLGVEPDEIRFHIGLSKTLQDQWERILEDVTQTIDELIGKN